MSESKPTNFVIAISSVSGGGKTTLVMKTAELLYAATLFFDDYVDESQYPKDIRKWVDDGADVNEWKTPHFAKDVAALRNGESVTLPTDGSKIQPSEFIVIEEPMGRARAEMTPNIDFVAVIDTPLEIALSRRFIRDVKYFDIDDKNAATKEELVEGFTNLVNYMRNFPRHYLDAGRDLYIAVQEQAKATCDLVLDGQLPADELAKQLAEIVKKERLS